jgi:hypothetical protein
VARGADTVVRADVDCAGAVAGECVEWSEWAVERCLGAGCRCRCGESRVAVASREWWRGARRWRRSESHCIDGDFSTRLSDKVHR